MTRYVIISPVRDEEQHLEATIRSVIGQTLRPTEWMIVDDGSTDQTGVILDRYAAQFPWIRVIHRPNRGSRKASWFDVDAFYEGYNALRCNDWDAVVKLDGDLSFSPDYFEKCFQHFDSDPRLGIGGGDLYINLQGKLTLEANPRFHVRGATKIYRQACWQAMGGLWTGIGWDTLDEVKANMLGWKTYSFDDLRLIHLRPTGAAVGLMRDRVKHGLTCYICGYHPLFLIASCFRRVIQKPYLVGSLAISWGFLKAYLTQTPRVNDKPLINYLRTQQLRRLCGLETIWK